ncbi:lysophospholipid acyltransferase family protein [Desulfocurvus vexinensis]|uniref:lysophospholipid acyltransferase family protein n=1 Tax=Desulfocurvus vexinensis TaxID=399548 RepID=UPI0004ACC9D3|nr:lysophospholipid acyltransferase family protein [Desulfocurvus vexinensis]
MKDLLYASLAAWGLGWGFERVRTRGEALGRLLWRALPQRREMACEAMVRLLGLSPEKARATALESFQHNGRSFLEILLAHRVDPRFVRERLRIVDPPSLAALQSQERPLVCVSAHLGAWELLAPVFHLLLPGREKQIVVRRPRDLALHALTTRLRSRPSLEVVDHRNAAPRVLRCLRRGGGAAFLVDHNTSTSEAVFLPFLGRIAAVNKGPALLALRAGAVVQPLFLLREGQGGYALYLEPTLDTRAVTGTHDEKIQKIALFYTQVVERMVRRHPEQWYWLHKRWKTQPPEGWTYSPPET